MRRLEKAAEKYYYCGQRSYIVPPVHKGDLESGYRGDSDITVKSAFLLTGRPGTGKTTLIKEAVAGLEGKAGGFYTEEIRVGGVRRGFRLVTLDGATAVLAHVATKGPHRVGKYGVDIECLDKVGVAALEKAVESGELVVVDEIGKMELFSERFRAVVERIVASGQKVLGTIMFPPHPWADVIKQKPLVKLIEVTRANHPQVMGELQNWLIGRV
jgi:nucleoside-triphosphatase